MLKELLHFPRDKSALALADTYRQQGKKKFWQVLWTSCRSVHKKYQRTDPRFMRHFYKVLAVGSVTWQASSTEAFLLTESESSLFAIGVASQKLRRASGPYGYLTLSLMPQVVPPSCFDETQMRVPSAWAAVSWCEIIFHSWLALSATDD